MTQVPVFTVQPIVRAQGSVVLPGSKSLSNRALLLAALASGTTHLTGVLRAEDTDRMIACLTALGVEIVRKDDNVTVHGCGGDFPVKQGQLFVGNAGTAARSLTAALAFTGGNYVLDGVKRMQERPIGDLLQALRSLGARIECTHSEGYPPLAFYPSRVTQDHVTVRANVSSQFLTALLLTAPRIARAGGLTIAIEGERISQPYVDMTVAMMRHFGVQVQAMDSGYHVPAGSYQAQADYAIEGDASAASYFLALGALAEGPVRVNGVGVGSLQGDVAFADVLERMGATVSRSTGFIEVSSPTDGILHGIEVDCTEIPDAAMTLVPMALKTQGPVVLTGIGSWRVKETDRIEAMAQEMSRFGAQVNSGADWIRVDAPDKKVLHGARVHTYEDHRMAMSLALAATAGLCVEVCHPECTSKTFPDYFSVLSRVCMAAGADNGR